MALKANGRTPSVAHIPAHRASLNAIQELIGALGDRETNVSRFFIREYELFVFAVRRNPPFTGQAATVPRRLSSREDSPVSSRKLLHTLDEIINAACARLDVSRIDLVSKSRSRQLSLGRALVARHATASQTASMQQIAPILNLSQNSLYVSIGRYRKLIPELFNMTLESFLDTSGEPSKRLQVVMGKKWSRSNAGTRASDAEIGERIAGALPPT